MNTSDIFKAVLTEEKLAKSEHYRINRQHFHQELVTWLFILAAV